MDFETKLVSKPKAAELLEIALRKSGYQCQTIALGVNIDAYQPIERKQEITRSVLEILQRFRHPVSIITESAMVERDIEIQREMAADQLVSVYISITTLDSELAPKWSPAPLPLTEAYKLFAHCVMLAYRFRYWLRR